MHMLELLQKIEALGIKPLDTLVLETLGGTNVPVVLKGYEDDVSKCIIEYVRLNGFTMRYTLNKARSSVPFKQIWSWEPETLEDVNAVASIRKDLQNKTSDYVK